MKSNFFILLLCFFSSMNSLYSQPGFEMVSNGGGNFQLNLYTNPINDLNGVPYNQIQGSPFLTDKWTPASIYNQKNELVGKLPVKLNLATGELYLLQGEMAVVADKNMAGKIILHSSANATDVKAVYLNFIPNLFVNGTKVTSFVEVFHAGYAILMKYRVKELTRSEGGGGMPKYYYFKNVVHYFLQVNGKVEKLSRLSEDIIEQLPGAYKLQGWVTENNLSLKKEEDLVKFISYYNQVKENETK